MASVDATTSQTILSLTQSKARELEKQQKAYETGRTTLLETTSNRPNVYEKVDLILSALVNDLQPQAAKDPMVTNISRWMQQARYDSSITERMLEGFEEYLLQQLKTRSSKLAMADLYSRLLMDWVNALSAKDNDGNVNTGPDEDAGSPSEGGYEVVDERQKQRLQQLCDQFERAVFEPLETNEDDINGFLNGLFPEEENIKVLESLRTSVKNQTTEQWEMEEPFNTTTLSACIRGLLTEDLLSEEKYAMLKSFLNNGVALNEIADVLNFRYADLKNWDWHAGDSGIPVLPRQQLNGKYRIWMDEDVLQTIFVQYIGIKLCNCLKVILRKFVATPGTWQWSLTPQISEHERLRRRYYLGSERLAGGLELTRKDDFVNQYFLCQLPLTQESLSKQGGSYDDDNDSDDDDDDDDDDDSEDSSEASKNTGNVKQKLLRKIVTETLLHRQLYGEAAVIQSDLKWYATSLSHNTIFAVMRFVGFTENWISFFRKYLESPLNMDQSSEGREQKGPRMRRRGVPMAHASEKLLGELVLFFMDLAVNRETGMLLYRLHDDLWLCGEPAKCARAWEVMNQYARVAGLEFNRGKTGSVYLADSKDPEIVSRLPRGPVTFGFLQLDEQSGDWVIDQTQVDAHVQQLQTQLNNCDNVVISWIRTWNSCIGRFFKNTFGQPANCFGGPHVESILATYEKMNKALFEKSNVQTVTDYLRHMIQTRFEVKDIHIPDAFFFLPEELGGLGLRNPFISILLVRDKMKHKPAKFLDDFKRREVEQYQVERSTFDDLSDRTLASRAEYINPLPDSETEKPPVIPRSEQRTFMSFDEWSRFRESSSIDLRQCYEELMDVPREERVKLTQATEAALKRAQEEMNLGSLDEEKKWILQLYSENLLTNFGGLNIVDKKFLPMGVLAMIREKRVKWQMVL